MKYNIKIMNSNKFYENMQENIIKNRFFNKSWKKTEKAGKFNYTHFFHIKLERQKS